MKDLALCGIPVWRSVELWGMAILSWVSSTWYLSWEGSCTVWQPLGQMNCLRKPEFTKKARLAVKGLQCFLKALFFGSTCKSVWWSSWGRFLKFHPLEFIRVMVGIILCQVSIRWRQISEDLNSAVKPRKSFSQDSLGFLKPQRMSWKWTSLSGEVQKVRWRWAWDVRRWLVGSVGPRVISVRLGSNTIWPWPFL